MPTLDPAVLLLVAVGTLAIVPVLLWRLRAPRDRGPRRDEIPPDLGVLPVGPTAQVILDRATRLDEPELRRLELGYRRLDRFWSGSSEERLMDVASGISQIIQPTGGVSEESSPLLRLAEARAGLLLGGSRERALLARAATIIEQAATAAGRPVSWRLARALADPVIAAEAGDGLAEDDRSLLAWPWRDAVEHVSTIPDPGRVVPLRVSAIVGLTVAIIAASVIATPTGDVATDISVIAFWLLSGGFVVAAATLFRLMVWRPVLSVAPGTANAGSGERGDLRAAVGRPPGRAARTERLPVEPSILPRRAVIVAMAVAAVLAGLAVAGGQTPLEAALGSGILGGFALGGVALLRLLVWRPIVRIRAGRPPFGGSIEPLSAHIETDQRGAGPLEPGHQASAVDLGPRVPSVARRTTAGIDLIGTLLGVLIVATCAWSLLIGDEIGTDEPETALVWFLVRVLLPPALPAFVAGILGARSARGPMRTFVWVIAGVVLGLATGLLVLAAAFDPGGEAWPYLAVLVPPLLGTSTLIGYGVGVFLGLRAMGRPIMPGLRAAAPSIGWRRNLDEGARVLPFILAALASALLGPTILAGTEAWFPGAPLLLSLLGAGLLVAAGYQVTTGHRGS